VFSFQPLPIKLDGVLHSFRLSLSVRVIREKPAIDQAEKGLVRFSTAGMLQYLSVDFPICLQGLPARIRLKSDCLLLKICLRDEFYRSKANGRFGILCFDLIYTGAAIVNILYHFSCYSSSSRNVSALGAP